MKKIFRFSITRNKMLWTFMKTVALSWLLSGLWTSFFGFGWRRVIYDNFTAACFVGLFVCILKQNGSKSLVRKTNSTGNHNAAVPQVKVTPATTQVQSPSVTNSSVKQSDGDNSVIKEPKQQPEPSKPQLKAPETKKEAVPVNEESSFGAFITNPSSFDDIAGYEETKERLSFIVDCIAKSELLKKAGAKIPRGVILYGPPGTGKTLFASAIAGTAGVNFLSVNAAEFVNKYVGVGASNVRNLYATAKKHAPCVVFIDELDAVGGHRSSDQNREYRSTINALLSEIDGLRSDSNILTIAATNTIDQLDEALIRPGRFDEKICIPMPNDSDRLAIIKLHSKNKSFSGITAEEISKRTSGFSGAAIATVLNEAAINAARHGHSDIYDEDISSAIFSMLTGAEERSSLSGKDLEIAAYHEAGHAITMKVLCNKTLPRVSCLIATNGNMGSTVSSGSLSAFSTRKSIENEIKSLFAGRAAEEILLKDPADITSGASDDIKRASEMIREYLVENGMGATSGLLNLEAFYQSKTSAQEYRAEAQQLAERLYQEVSEFLIAHKDLLDEVAYELIEKKSLLDDEVEAIVRKYIV